MEPPLIERHIPERRDGTIVVIKGLSVGCDIEPVHGWMMDCYIDVLEAESLLKMPLTRVSRHPSQKRTEDESKKNEHSTVGSRQRVVNQNHQKKKKEEKVRPPVDKTGKELEAPFC